MADITPVGYVCAGLMQFVIRFSNYVVASEVFQINYVYEYGRLKQWYYFLSQRAAD